MVDAARAESQPGLGPARAAQRARADADEDACRADAAVTDALASVIEGEILPRLRLLHRAPGDAPTTIRQPTAAETDRLHALLLAPGPVDLDAETAALLDGGMSLDTLLLDLLVPAARHLGMLWEEDLCDFIAVTEGLGRLQVLTRRLCAGLEKEPSDAGRSILLMPCPGETHLYALSVVASFFREAGWAATILDGARSAAADLVRDEWFDAIGLSLACDVHLPVLRDTADLLRNASLNPAPVVIVGGPWFARNEIEPREVGADACAADGKAAPRIADTLLDRRDHSRRGSTPPGQ